MSFEKAAPAGSDVGDDFQRATDESQLSHRPGSKSDLEAPLEDDAPPDGGTAAWLVVLGGWCCSFNSMGWMNSKLSPMPMFSLRELDTACHEQAT